MSAQKNSFEWLLASYRFSILTMPSKHCSSGGIRQRISARWDVFLAQVASEAEDASSELVLPHLLSLRLPQLIRIFPQGRIKEAGSQIQVPGDSITIVLVC